MTITAPKPDSAGRADVHRYLDATSALETTRVEVETLERSEGVGSFNRQLDLLKRRLLTQPEAFRDMFLADGMQAVAWEFRQPELSEAFVRSLWATLMRGDDSSRVIMRFVWNLPLKQKRLFVRGLDQHLSDRYPMFDGFAAEWPAGSSIEPYVREADARAQDFGLVNQGYLGYMNLGYTAAEVDLFVWLEALRDKQCTEKPCELGVFLANHKA
ncbi:MAG TPA: hypothetical protein VGK17_24790, partial [Propionicimonas sp.]